VVIEARIRFNLLAALFVSGHMNIEDRVAARLQVDEHFGAKTNMT
jgi:hypothetical protein